MNPIATFLDRQRFMVLDGGLATELEARGFDLADPLWSAKVLLEEPDAIRRLHHDFLVAGADCITSATYQATLAGFADRGLSRRQGEALLRSAVELAIEARDTFWREPEHRVGRIRPVVAASIGPYGAFLANGAEYTGDYDLDEDGLVDFHRSRFELLTTSGADLMACETIPSRAEARALRRVIEDALDPNAPPLAWMSFSCGDGSCLRDGSDLGEVATELADCAGLVALGVNCTEPRLVPSLIASLAADWPRSIVVYPNSGEAYDAQAKGWSGDPAAVDLGAAGAGWLASGARLIGGCCRVGPSQIRGLRQCLEVASSRISRPADAPTS